MANGILPLFFLRFQQVYYNARDKYSEINDAQLENLIRQHTTKTISISERSPRCYITGEPPNRLLDFQIHQASESLKSVQHVQAEK